ncbi:MAG: acyl-CoA/acyl-ACP dehydrogenase, partial [Actinomycetota bacterium]|nr:acyl-CoA/acyl-ACP dehydrogenase [Actinomycetota bacterium]
DRVLQIHGGMGYTKELPIEGWYRLVRLYRIFEGTDEMQRLIISRDLLRGYTKIGGHLA